MPEPFRFPAALRLNGNDFGPVFEAKCSVSDRLLIVYGRANDGQATRLGMTVSRRVGPAHYRNHWKRLIRESFRLRQYQLPEGIDLVVLPRSKTVPGLVELESSILALSQEVAKKLGARKR